VGHEAKIAHARDGVPHLLDDHLNAVAELAESFANSLGNGDWARAAGLWHDLGKYKDDFQEYIRRVTGYERDEAEEGGPGKVDHTAAGAIHAMEKMSVEYARLMRLQAPNAPEATIEEYARGFGRILAYLIAGHHSGLPDWIKDQAPGRGLQERLTERNHLAEALSGSPPQEILEAGVPASFPCGGRINQEYAHLWIRMLFSCLVDADFLDTEAFMAPEKAEHRPQGADLENLRAKYDAYMERKQAGAPDTPVNRLRRQILEDCRSGAEKAPGFFSLTVPTGGGKTLASMGFALDHAIRHGKRRIVVAIPYTSIIEQTAETLREVFGDEAVLEHHSNLDPDRETPQSKLATENWDAPIVVTTNVQLFESLFAARTSACRKLHNLVDSVLILDEAQMLPTEFLKPILSMLQGLVDLFGISVVLCTATQPALVGKIGGNFDGLPEGKVRELMRSTEDLSRALARVRVERHANGTDPCSWSEIATELQESRQVLCIVNTRKDCRELHGLLPEGAIHLSALMCGEHRSQVIADIKRRLASNEPIRVVSTQLVEAGVDLDFPVVYRALAGLDSIAQAAGRCNREGKLSEGRVVVFAPPKPSGSGLLRKGEDATKEFLRVSPESALSLSPESFRRYFKLYFSMLNGFDKQEILPLLAGTDARQFQIQFRTAAQRFQLIDDLQKPIVVRFQGGKIDSQKLLENLTRFGPTRKTMRRLQRCTVNVPERCWRALVDQGSVQELVGPDKKPLGMWAQCVPDLYDPIFGLRLEDKDYDCVV
jgi:CRISPR-associated endonuclease/helicase Cas3